MAILISIAFSLDLGATPSLILLTSVYYGAMYDGRISSILLNIPGDELAMMTCIDGYPIAKQGKAGEALSLSGASFVGAFPAYSLEKRTVDRDGRTFCKGDPRDVAAPGPQQCCWLCCCN